MAEEPQSRSPSSSNTQRFIGRLQVCGRHGIGQRGPWKRPGATFFAIWPLLMSPCWGMSSHSGDSTLADQGKKNVADAQFKKLQRVAEGKRAASDYEASQAAGYAKTAKLKAE